MAELILTEKETKMDWHELPFETLGKLVVETMHWYNNGESVRCEKKDMESIMDVAMMQIAINTAVNLNCDRIIHKMEGLNIKGVDLGDWTITVEKLVKGEKIKTK